MTSSTLQAPKPAPTPTAVPAPGSSINGDHLARNDAAMLEIRDLLREAVQGADSPDLEAAVAEVLRSFVVGRRYDLLVQAAREGLIGMAWEYARHDPLRKASRRGAARSGKWDAIAETSSRNRDIFEASVWTGTERKFLGDCTKADLNGAAEVKEKQGTTLLDNADRLRKLGRKLKVDQVVADLDRLVVEGVFDA